jgi:hypothetical protein
MNSSKGSSLAPLRLLSKALALNTSKGAAESA